MICICGFVILIRIEMDMFYVVIQFLSEIKLFSDDVSHFLSAVVEEGEIVGF